MIKIYLCNLVPFVCIMTSVAGFIVFNFLAVAAEDVSVMDLLHLFQQFYHLLTFEELLQLDLV